jgi:hypothetical protein
MTRLKRFAGAAGLVPRNPAGTQRTTESWDGAAAELIVRSADARQSLPPGDRVGEGVFAGTTEETD